MAIDPENQHANHGGQMLDSVTKDQLNTGLSGQIRYRVSERNLYAYFFGVKSPFIHIMGYFISILRERIANFEAPQKMIELPSAAGRRRIPKSAKRSPSRICWPSPKPESGITIGVSINDLRKNLRDLNEHMERECRSSAARYGIELDASLITEIDPPPEVESALAAINTAHNQVSSDISLAQASADQKIVQSKRAVEIETLQAQAEVEPLRSVAAQLGELKKHGPSALPAYLRNVRLKLYKQAGRAILEVKK